MPNRNVKIDILQHNPKLTYTPKVDRLDLRLGDLIKKTSDFNKTDNQSTCIIGYPDDEGIILNSGRPGAKEAPLKIREYLYKMTPPVISKDSIFTQIVDLGDFSWDIHSKIEQKHQDGKNVLNTILSNQSKVLSFGGGHDFAYCDGAGFLDSLSKTNESNKIKSRPLIINFDAHFDVRDSKFGLNSGTAFYRLCEEYKKKFDLIQIGIQTQCNSRHHAQWIYNQGGKILYWDEIMLSGETPTLCISRFLESELVRPRPTFLSIDIDCFSSSEAMGCSQSWPAGFRYNDFLPILKILLKRLDIRVMGVYEVSPPLDLENLTSKLAALISYQFLFNSSEY